MASLTPLQRRGLWLVGGVVLAAALLAGGLALRSPQVDAVQLQPAPLVRTLQFSARVATLSRVDVGSTITGRVAQVLVTEGAQVRKGDALLRLESDELSAAVTQAVAAERQAAARLAGLRSTGRASAGAALAQADATLRAAQAELTRVEQLVAQAQQASARAQTQANAEAGTDLVQAQAQLALAQAATQSARARLAQAVVLAPADAKVLAREVEPGQIVQPGKPLLSLALAGPTQLLAQVDERFLDQLQAGQPATVVADAFASQRFAARVLSIAPAVDAQRGAVEVKFTLLQAPPPYLREDMTLSVEVETARRERALVMPLAALQATTPGGSPTVLVSADGRARARAVQLGLRTLDAAEVLGGLTAGETVLVGSALHDGQRVRARALAWKPGQAAAPGAPQDAGAALSNAMGR